MKRLIEDYAMIGDLHTAGLIGRDGSLDWLCLPRFDSPACFAALLGDEDNGHWLIAPDAEGATVRRYYRGDTLVLESEFHTATGSVAIIDFMPHAPERDRTDVIRLIEGRTGQVAMRTDLVFRFGYGRVIPWLRREKDGLSAIAGPTAMRLRTPVDLHGEDFITTAQFNVASGEVIPFVLSCFASHRPVPDPIDPVEQLSKTEQWWRDWSSRCSYTGPWREAVMRSLITLKALTYAPTGGIVAAPTTSLPEIIGGGRNWDYRYCWIRDASLTLEALLISGFHEEARAWREWLLRSVAGSPAQLQTIYGVAGERGINEFELPWLKGFGASRPVRIGNDASGQFQLDVYGELMDAFHVARAHRIEPLDHAWAVQKLLLEFLESNWNEPDDGIWEVRGPRRHFTYSKVMAWVAMSRGVEAVRRFHLDGPAEHWATLRDQIHTDICRHGFDAKRGTFVQYYGASGLDAALLLMPLVGFLPVSDPRMAATIEAIGNELATDGLVRRYNTDDGVDGLEGGEGVFLACSFWLADNLALMGKRREAEAIYQRLLDLRNDVGLLAEEFDPDAGHFLGNFPQAFSHIALINTAFNLSTKHGPSVRRTAG